MKKYLVVGIGNAIVDVFAQADDSFLELMGIEKGIMHRWVLDLEFAVGAVV